MSEIETLRETIAALHKDRANQAYALDLVCQASTEVQIMLLELLRPHMADDVISGRLDNALRLRRFNPEKNLPIEGLVSDQIANLRQFLEAMAFGDGISKGSLN
jgi:hypothetical protein